jgi:F-type H+-transporting ATPase subunit b
MRRGLLFFVLAVAFSVSLMATEVIGYVVCSTTPNNKGDVPSAKKCIDAGAPAVLASDEGKVYKVDKDHQDRLAYFAGKKVTINGTIKDDTITASSIKEGDESSWMKAWEWANFLVLAAGLGFILGKNAGPAFAARSRKINQELVEARRMKEEADARVAAVERRLANLQADIAALRAEAQREEQAEVSRCAQQTRAEIAKIQAHAEQEIASAHKAARMELKREAARLALDIAEVKLKARMTAPTDDNRPGEVHDKVLARLLELTR